MRLERDARRQQLIEAAIRVFARDGYHTTDVAAIVAEAGVARGTFYLHFPTKRDIFLAVIDQYLVLRQQPSEQEALPASAPLRAQFAHAFAQVLRRHAAHRDLALVILRESGAADPKIAAHLRAAGDAGRASLAATYDRLIVAGRLRPCDSHLVATAISGLLREVLLHEVLLRGRVEEIDTLASELAALVYDGLHPMPGPAA